VTSPNEPPRLSDRVETSPLRLSTSTRMSNETRVPGRGTDAEKGHAGQDSNGLNDGGGPFLAGRAITPGGHALDQSQAGFPIYHRKFANPAPLGLSAFALTTFVLSLVNSKAHGVTVPNIVIGLALGYGGLVQLLAGMWEFASGNTFGATAFSSYGGFWISFAFVISSWGGVASAYTDDAMFGSAVGFYLLGWFIFTFIMLLASMRSSIGLMGVFFFLTITFLLLGVGEFYPTKPNIAVAGGVFGLITAFNAWYVALCGLLSPETSFFVLPVGDLSKRD